MALINCPECGQQISDKAQTCPICGHPMGVNYNYSGNGSDGQQFSSQQTVPLTQQLRPYDPKPKNSGLSIAALICSLFGCTAIIGFILAIVDLTKKDDKKKTGSIAALVICGIWVILLLFASCSSSSSTNKTEPTQQTATEETTVQEDANTEPTETEDPQDANTDPVDKEEFIASCQEIPYKTLARNPEDYIGAHIVLTVKVSQILQGGMFDNNQYYHVYTDDEWGTWFGDEYFMYDNRADDNTRILEDDILTVYAEFSGLETVERALTKTAEEIPSITAIYVTIQDEDTYTGNSAVGTDSAIVDDGLTTGQRNAIASAKSYLQYSAFSMDGLIHQLEYEQYSTEDATFADDNCGADWNEQAALSAKSYLQYSSFSRGGLIEQLEYEGFTTEQAVYGVEANGY